MALRRALGTALLLVALAMATQAQTASGRVLSCQALLQRIYHYAQQADTTASADSSGAYTKFYLSIDRKNPTLMLVPSVYAIAHHKERHFTGETFSMVCRKPNGHHESKSLASLSTVPRQHTPFGIMLRYLTPQIYSETIIENTIISPFHAANRHFYKYQTSTLADTLALLTITPKRNNTQLVIGTAIVHAPSGRIVSCDLTGEYDMTNFKMHIDMGHTATNHPLIPTRCEVDIRFRFVRSKVTGKYVAVYALPLPAADHPVWQGQPSASPQDRYTSLCMLRPEPLTADELAVYHRAGIAPHTDMAASADTLQPNAAAAHNDPLQTTGIKKARNFYKDVLWDMVGDNVFNRVKTHFGLNNQGYIRLNPVLNPLYMGYDHRRGFTYKFDIRASYQFSQNTEVSMRLKAGYAFRQHQFFFRLPVYLYFNKRRNGYVKLEWNNGNHILNASVRRHIQQQYPDSTLSGYDKLNEFKQNEVRAVFNYDLSEHWSFQLGTLYQRKSAVYKQEFDLLGWRKTYTSLAPVAELQYRPAGWNGPIITLDYDRGIKGIADANTGYERWEINADYLLRVNRLQTWKMRVGTGFYTNKDHDACFLNYENFRENNLPGGWDENLYQEFELLRGDTYNTSDYYLRANLSYESPLLLLSWLPRVGHYVEMERVYVSLLDTRNVHPYVEVGYGFTCRLMSLGLFVSNGRGNRVIGATFGFELFRHW